MIFPSCIFQLLEINKPIIAIIDWAQCIIFFRFEMTSKVEAPKDYKALTKKYFTKLENDVYKCHCGKLLKRKDGTGWSNLMQHIRSQHGNDNTSISDQQTLRFMHCRKSETVYGWLEWVCMELKPFSFVESSLTRKYSSLDKISVHTLEKYMHLVSDRVEKEIANNTPIVNNTTRWLSVMQMIERYMKIKDHLQHIPAMISFMLCPAEDARLKELGELLEPLKSVTLALQRSDMDMASARLLLDEIIKKVSIDGRKKYIHVNSSIVKNKDFENGVVKILNSDENLTLQENLAVKKLRLHVQEVEEMGKENEVPLDFAMEILRKRRCERRSDKYLDCRFLVPTSNLMERLFSRAGYAYDDLRRKIQPIYLEQQLFLMSNKRLWDLSLVNEVVNATEWLFEFIIFGQIFINFVWIYALTTVVLICQLLQ